MQLRIGQKVFAPALLPTVLTLLLLPTFISLGCWQLRRADEKRALMAQAAAGQSQTIVLSAGNADQVPRYQHVQVRGVFDTQHQVLLDNMPSSQGQPGYRVWTPLKLSDASVVLVDRGWIANWMSGAASKKSYPSIEVGDQPRTITGLVDELPQPGIRAGNAGMTEHWPQVLNFPKIDELRSLYGASLQTRIVLMDADNSDGFERHWQIKQGFTPERHIGYAVQWFGFALTLIVIYIAVNLKQKS
jgi:surfeit locus 1 family protein